MARKSDSKRSFKLFNDYKLKTDKLSDEEAGQLFKAILSYVNDTSVIPKLENRVVDMAFTDIRGQLDRDREAYDYQCSVNRANGSLGGRPPRKQSPGQMELDLEKPKETESNRTEPKKPIRLSGGEDQKEEQPQKPKTVEYSTGFKELWEIYPRKDSKAAAYRNYQKRLKDGYSPDELMEAARNYRDFCDRTHRDKQYTYKARTFFDADGEFTTYMNKAEKNEPKPGGDGYGEVDFRQYM